LQEIGRRIKSAVSRENKDEMFWSEERRQSKKPVKM
jgi:hypothetical protein